MIDTHCHLYLPEFDADRAEVVERAQCLGIRYVLLPNVDASTIAALWETCRQFPALCKPMIGLHPCSVATDWEQQIARIRQSLSAPEWPLVAIGETGLDFYWNTSHIALQKKNFQQHIDWAKTLRLPLIIHSRKALDDCIELVERNKDSRLTGIFHCFSGTLDQARRIIDLNFLLGIGGVVTFKNSGLGQVLPHIPLECIVLETDAPYLAPAPFRGKRNEISYLVYIVRRVAEILEMTESEVALQTTKNACRLFHLAPTATHFL